MFKWIERKILRPIIKNPVKSIIGGVAIASLGPTAAGVIGKLAKPAVGAIGKLSTGTKVALASSAASMTGAILTRNDAEKENTSVLAANKAESERVYEQNKKEVVESREYNTQVRENYYKNLVKDAQEAGINPLTALRAGGGSAYGNAVAGTMAQSVFMDGVYATPTLSRNPIAAGLETGVNVGLAEFTRKQNYSHESRMDELTKDLMRAQIKSMNAEVSRNVEDPTFFGNRNNSNETRPLEDRTTTVDGMTVNDKLVSGWHAMTLPNGMIVPMPFDPQDSDIGAMVGSAMRVMGIETPMMAGANLKDWVSTNRSKRRFREMYTRVNKDSILRKLQTMQNELSFNIKPKIQPLSRNNHFLTLPR